MISISGNNSEKIDKEQFQLKLGSYNKAVLDLGTGDGRFVYKKTLEFRNTFFVGIDPAEKQLQVYSTKANRKKLNNCMFIVGSIENMPNELYNSFDEIYINLPWGSLLEKIININENFVEKIQSLLKKHGSVYITFGYELELEPSETKRLKLPSIDEKYVKNNVLPILKKHFQTVIFKQLTKKDVGKIETTWAKKLKFGRDRNIYGIEMRK